MAMSFSVLLQRQVVSLIHYCHSPPHTPNPRPASAAALLKQELAATSAAGALTF